MRGGIQSVRGFRPEDAADYFDKSLFPLRRVGWSSDEVSELQRMGYEEFRRWSAWVNPSTGHYWGPAKRTDRSDRGTRFLVFKISSAKTHEIAAVMDENVRERLRELHTNQASNVITYLAKTGMCRFRENGIERTSEIEEVEFVIAPNVSASSSEAYRFTYLCMNMRAFSEGEWRAVNSREIFRRILDIRQIINEGLYEDEVLNAHLQSVVERKIPRYKTLLALSDIQSDISRGLSAKGLVPDEFVSVVDGLPRKWEAETWS